MSYPAKSLAVVAGCLLAVGCAKNRGTSHDEPPDFSTEPVPVAPQGEYYHGDGHPGPQGGRILPPAPPRFTPSAPGFLPPPPAPPAETSSTPRGLFNTAGLQLGDLLPPAERQVAHIQTNADVTIARPREKKDESIEDWPH